MPEEVLAEYERVFRKLGVDETSELRLRGRGDADGDEAAALLSDATGVFFTGGDQAKLRTLVGSRANDIIADRLAADGLTVAGTSAGATAMGRTMILGAGRGRPGGGALGGGSGALGSGSGASAGAAAPAYRRPLSGQGPAWGCSRRP